MGINQRLFGVKPFVTRCPLSPLLFSNYLNNIDSKDLWGTGCAHNVLLWKKCCLLMTFPSLPNEHANLQTMLSKLRVYAEKNKSLTVNTQPEVRGNVLQFQLWIPAPPPCTLTVYASLHGLSQIFGHGVQQVDQSEYRGWRNTLPIHSRHVQSQRVCSET